MSSIRQAGSNPIRIKTKIGNDKVITLPAINIQNYIWITITTKNGMTSSIDAKDMLEAGKNHLQACAFVQDLNLF